MTDTAASKRTFDRVRKLLAKAEGTTNEHERETFMKAARGLMAKYGIEQSKLGHLSGRQKPELRSIEVLAPHSDEQAMLAVGVAEALRCRAVLMRVRGSKDGTVEIIGFAYDQDRIELLYPSLLLQMLGGVERQSVPRGESKLIYRRSWLLGFITEAVEKLKAAEKFAADEQQAKDEPGEVSTALVLLNKDQVIDTVFAKLYPKIGKSRKVNVNNDAWDRGAEAGRRADVGGSRIDATGTGQLTR